MFFQLTWGGLPSDGTRAKETRSEFTGAWATACSQEETCGNTGSPPGAYRGFREEWTERGGMAERPVVLEKPGNAGGGKGPWFKSGVQRSEGKEIGASLTTPKSVWELQQALHAKAKREPACRFHSLYDKLYRKDVLWHAWRCCRANGGAPGVLHLNVHGSTGLFLSHRHTTATQTGSAVAEASVC